jgi:hypothetical protein
VYLHTKICGKIKREIQFVSPANQWIFDLCPKEEITAAKKSNEIQKTDILHLLNPEERRLFEYVYGNIFIGEKGKTVKQICDLMAYGNEETYRIRKMKLVQKIIQSRYLRR